MTAHERARSACSRGASSTARSTGIGRRRPSRSSRPRRRCPSAQEPGRSAQGSLGHGQAECPRGGDDRRQGQGPGLGHVGGQYWKRPPAGREADVVVDDAPEELEVVAHDQKGPDDEKRHQRRTDLDDAGDPERDGTGQTPGRRGDERGPGYPRAQRSAVQLVEGVGGQADGEEEGQQGGDQSGDVDDRCQAGAHDHVGKVPPGVGRMQEGPPVAPAAGPGCVVGGSLLGVGAARRRGFTHRRACPT